jgi:hypothetical protein
MSQLHNTLGEMQAWRPSRARAHRISGKTSRPPTHAVEANWALPDARRHGIE